MRLRRIAICTSQVPFTTGGAELHARGLQRALQGHGYETEIIAVPFRWYPPAEIVKHMLAWRLLDVTEAGGNRIDLVVALRFPAYLVRHPHKVVWLMHQHKAAYEWWPSEYGDLAAADDGQRVRDIIIGSDNTELRAAHRLFANSRTVAERLKRFNGIDAPPLYHPPPLVEQLAPGECGDYIFCPSRLERTKRQSLLMEAMAHLRSDAKCYIAGTGPDEAALRQLITAHHLESRVMLLGHVSQEELVRYYANARAVFFGPFDEDYGYVTLEALHAGKAVISLDDSGGPLEFIEHGINGLIVPPAPQEIAAAIDTLFEDRALAERMGRTGREMIRDRGISWDAVVEALIA